MTELREARVGLTPYPYNLIVTPDKQQAAAVVERAKGVLMERYDLDAATAAGVLLVWSAQRLVAPAEVADVLVNDISVGRESMTNPELARWLERCLRALP